LLVLRQKNQARIQTEEIATIPFGVIVAFTREPLLKPGGKMVIDEKINLEVNMGAFFGNALPGIGGAAHRRDVLTRFDSVPDAQIGPNCAQVGVERENVNALNPVAQDDVLAIVRQPGFGVKVSNGAVGRCHNRVERLASPVPSNTFDVQPFVHLAAIRTDTAKHPGGPRLPYGANKKAVTAVDLKQSVIRRGELKELSRRRCGVPADEAEQRTEKE
jgi:hypothetical protein